MTYLWGWNYGTCCPTPNGFRDIRSPENRKCTEWPQTELEHLRVKGTINTYPKDQSLVHFAVCLAVSESRSSKIWNTCTPNSKNTLYTLKCYLRGPNFGQFRSTTSRFWDTMSTKITDAPNDPNLTWTHNSQKYPVYTKYLPLRQKIWSLTLYDQPFPRYKDVKNRKCTTWPQNELEHLTVPLKALCIG